MLSAEYTISLEEQSLKRKNRKKKPKTRFIYILPNYLSKTLQQA